MEHSLTTFFVAVHYQSITRFIDTEFCSEFGARQHHMTEKRLIFDLGVIRRRDVFLRVLLKRG